MSGEEWKQRLPHCGELAGKFVDLADKLKMKPGEAALGMMMAAFGITRSVAQIPSFEWYAAQVIEILGPRRGQ